MRKLTASFFVSLDGVVEAPQEWHFPYMNDEMGAVIGAAIQSSDAFLLGRRTYDEWAAYWPHQSVVDNPMAAAINGAPKFVVSRSLDSVTWENSTLLDGNLVGEVTKLKAQRGKDISVSGSATLVRSLLSEGLLDELRLMVHPVVVGTGARLFDEAGGHTALELVDSATFFSAREVARSLDTTAASVNSALQRARLTLDQRLPERSQQATARTLGDQQLRDTVERYVNAWQSRDVDSMVALLAEDASFAMPPHPNWFRGRTAVIEFITGVGAPPLRSALTTANGQPAVGWYILDREQDSFLPVSIEVLTLEGNRVKDIVAFVSPGLFERFGLPVAV
jgi:dihydrofolate reductase